MLLFQQSCSRQMADNDVENADGSWFRIFWAQSSHNLLLHLIACFPLCEDDYSWPINIGGIVIRRTSFEYVHRWRRNRFGVWTPAQLTFENPIDVIFYLKFSNFHRFNLFNFSQWWKDVCSWISRISSQSFCYCLTEPIVRMIGFESLWKIHIFEQFTSRVNAALNCAKLFRRKINKRCASASGMKNEVNPTTKNRNMKSIWYFEIYSSTGQWKIEYLIYVKIWKGFCL